MARNLVGSCSFAACSQSSRQSSLVWARMQGVWGTFCNIIYRRRYKPTPTKEPVARAGVYCESLTCPALSRVVLGWLLETWVFGLKSSILTGVASCEVLPKGHVEPLLPFVCQWPRGSRRKGQPLAGLPRGGKLRREACAP
jgi:hypothetical protein